MKRLVPFADLLAHLRAAGLAIGIDDHLAVQHLVERYDGADPGELGDALAALLGRSEAEVTQIRRELDTLYGPPGAPPSQPSQMLRAPAPHSKRGTGVTLRFVLALVLLFEVVVVVVALLVVGRSTEARHVKDVTLPPGAARAVTPIVGQTASQAGCPKPLVTARPQHRPLPPWVGLGLLGIAAGVFAGQLVRRRRRRARLVRKRRLATLPGPRGYKVAAGARLSRALLDDVAILLTTRSGTRELDVERTVERTARAGLAPVLAYRTSRRRLPVAISIDREREMRPFRPAALELARGLQDRGVVVEQPAGLAAPTRADAIAIVISTGAALNDPEARLPAWMLERAERGRIVWITPIEDRRLWPPLLRAARMPTFPFNRAGLLAATRYLGGEDPVAPSAPVLRWEDVERLRAMLAVSLDHAPEISERLRRKFLPDAPQSIHAAVHDEPLPDASHAAAWLAQVEPGLDVQVRRFLIGVLDTAAPAAGSAGYLRWRRDRAVLMSGVPDQASAAQRELADLAGGPPGAAAPHGAPRLDQASEAPRSPSWFPGVLVSVGLVLAAIGALVLPMFSRIREVSPTFDDTVYQLRMETDGALRRRLRVEPVVAAALDLYDNGVRVGALGGSFDIPPGAHCYEIWQPVSEDRFAGSPPLSVDEGPGELVIKFSSSHEGALGDQAYTVASASGAADTRSGLSGVPLTLPAGAWTATASRAGHVGWVRGLTIEPGKRLELDAIMTTAYALVTLRAPVGMPPSRLLVDGAVWDGQVLQRPPGPLRITSADPRYVVDQTVEIEADKDQTIDVVAQILGSVRVQVSPAAARKTLTIEAPPGFRAIGAQIFGLGDATVTLHASEYRDAELAISLLAGRTSTQSVNLTRAPVSPAPAYCAKLAIDDLMSQAADQYSKGFAKAALAIITKALACKQSLQMYRRAAIYACAARDVASAELYNSKLSPLDQSVTLQRCRQEGIYLPSGAPSKSPGTTKGAKVD